MKIFTLVLSLAVFNVLVCGQKPKVTVYLAGDSTLAEKMPDKRPETGWGEKLQSYFDEAKVKIENHAQNGRSTKSFIDEGRWRAIVDKLKKGDYVFIEFGHNDEKIDKPAVYAAAATDYRNNLIRFVNEVRAKKAFPVLLTPVMRRRFDEKGEFYDTHGEYPNAVRTVSRQLGAPLIDLHRASEKLIKSYGAENSKKLFLHLPAGANQNYPNGAADDTHFSPLGAEEMARLAIAEIKSQQIALRKYLKK